MNVIRKCLPVYLRNTSKAYQETPKPCQVNSTVQGNCQIHVYRSLINYIDTGSYQETNVPVMVYAYEH